MKTKKQTKKQETKKETKTKINEEKIKEVGSLLLTAAEITILRNEKDVLMKECGKLAGQLAVAEREKQEIAEKIKEYISSAEVIIEENRNLVRKIDYLCIIIFLTLLFGYFLGKVF